MNHIDEGMSVLLVEAFVALVSDMLEALDAMLASMGNLITLASKRRRKRL